MTGGSPNDVRFMTQALTLAARGAGRVAPNPLVGAVIVRDGKVVGEGWHAVSGGPHAEVVALNAAGDRARNATLYVTLEPCNHHGKTPPCTQAIINAGIARVVYAIPDPNPVAAGGAERLQAAGIAVTSGVEATAAAELNAPFLFAARGAQRPFVTVKLAVSVDGAIVDASRARGWLTGPEARIAVHQLRASADAVAVGLGTALADDPALTVRDVEAPRVPPRRVVFDRQVRLPLGSQLATTARVSPVVLVVDPASETDLAASGRRTALESAGVEFLVAATVDEALTALRSQGIRHLLVEGGATLASTLLEAGFVDRLITFQAPVILGAQALPAFAALPSRAASSAPRMRVIARREYGADLMTTYAVSGD